MANSRASDVPTKRDLVPRLSRAWLRIVRHAGAWRTARSRGGIKYVRVLQQAAKFIFDNFYNFVVKLPSAVVIIVVAAILIRGLMQHVTVVQPVSVPKVLSDRGFTPEVAAGRLRDAMLDFRANVNTRMRHSDIALHGEGPNIVLPAVGITLDAIMSSLRALWPSKRSHSIAGEFTIIQDKLWLRLRLDGRHFYSSEEGGDPEKPDELLRIATPQVFMRIEPYIVAWSIRDSNPAAAFEMVNEIIADRPEWDENVVWSYNLRSSILRERKDYSAAAQAAEKALQLDPRSAVVRMNIANALAAEGGDVDRAIEEYQNAIKLEPKYAHVHFNLGRVLSGKGDNEKAITAFREAVRLDRKFAPARAGLGLALSAIGQDAEAITAFREAIRLDPKYALARRGLGAALSRTGQDAEAIAEYRAILEIDPNDVSARESLDRLLIGPVKSNY